MTVSMTLRTRSSGAVGGGWGEDVETGESARARSEGRVREKEEERERERERPATSRVCEVLGNARSSTKSLPAKETLAGLSC